MIPRRERAASAADSRASDRRPRRRTGQVVEGALDHPYAAPTGIVIARARGAPLAPSRCGPLRSGLARVIAVSDLGAIAVAGIVWRRGSGPMAERT